MFMFLIDCEKDRESENIVNRLSVSWTALASAVKIVDSLERRAEKMSFSITAATATLL
jgi:hypothetical protein